jgi:hypothetical protein
MLNRMMSVALMGAALMGGAPAMTYQPPQITANSNKRRRQGLFNGQFYQEQGARLLGRKGAGIGMAQQQRAAAKARNVKRHKATVRG